MYGIYSSFKAGPPRRTLATLRVLGNFRLLGLIHKAGHVTSVCDIGVSLVAHKYIVRRRHVLVALKVCFVVGAIQSRQCIVGDVNRILFRQPYSLRRSASLRRILFTSFPSTHSMVI